MNFSVEHIAIPATNPVALKNWYERVLGAQDGFQQWPESAGVPDFIGQRLVEIYAAETPLPGRGNNKLAGFRHLALRVDSLDAAKG